MVIESTTTTRRGVGGVGEGYHDLDMSPKRKRQRIEGYNIVMHNGTTAPIKGDNTRSRGEEEEEGIIIRRGGGMTEGQGQEQHQASSSSSTQTAPAVAPPLPPIEGQEGGGAVAAASTPAEDSGGGEEEEDDHEEEVDIIDISDDDDVVNNNEVLEVSSDSGSEDDEDEDDDVEVVINGDTGGAIAITEDEAEDGSDDDDSGVEFIGEGIVEGPNWEVRRHYRGLLDNNALNALDRHLGIAPAPPPPPPPVYGNFINHHQVNEDDDDVPQEVQHHILPNAFVNRANRERLRAGGVRRYAGGNIPPLRDLDNNNNDYHHDHDHHPLYAIRYPRGNGQRCDVCHQRIALNSTVVCFHSRSVIKSVHVECTSQSRAMYRPGDIGIDVIFQEEVANDDGEVDRVINTLSHLRSQRLINREGNLLRRRNDRRHQHLGGAGVGGGRAGYLQQGYGAQNRAGGGGGHIAFDNGIHEGLLAFNWYMPLGFGLPPHNNNQHQPNHLYHSSIAEALLRGRIAPPPRGGRGSPPPSIPAILKKCKRVIIKKTDLDPDTKDFRECTICLEPMKTRQAVLELPCEHRYHRGCIERWFKTASQKDPTNVRCPLDKRSLFDMLDEPSPDDGVIG